MGLEIEVLAQEELRARVELYNYIDADHTKLGIPPYYQNS